VRTVSTKPKERGLKPWIDDEQIMPGALIQETIQEAALFRKTAAIFLDYYDFPR
jgi:hypothetical protein